MIPQGYKQTEIGVIPEDWDIKQFSQLFTIGHGKNQKEIENKTGKYPILATSGVIGYTNSYLWDKPSALIGRKGTINKPQYIDIPFWTIDTLFFTKILGTAFPKYVYYLFCTVDWLSLNEASGVPSLSANNIEKINYAVPSFAEQQRIAEALSDVDSMISSLEKLIAKKKAIKQGAMQELLTGKKRLSGFTGAWIEKRIENVAEVGRGRVISHIEISKNIGGKYPVYSSQTTNNGIMGYLRTYDFDGDYITWTTDGVNAGTVFHRSGKFNCTNVCGTLKCRDVNTDFVARRLGVETHNYVATNLANPKLMNDVMKRIVITLPPTIDEQTAITSILSDMDSEIEALEQKLEKTRQIKQGMMQQLLTGKIRLV